MVVSTPLKNMKVSWDYSSQHMYIYIYIIMIWRFPNIGVPIINGWFVRENPMENPMKIRMMTGGYPYCIDFSAFRLGSEATDLSGNASQSTSLGTGPWHDMAGARLGWGGLEVGGRGLEDG